MKITASTRDDILKRKAEFDADYAERKARYDEQYGAYRKAEHDITSAVEEELTHQLSRFRSLDFQVECSRARHLKDFDGLRVTVMCNENNKFADTSALSWSYRAEITDDGTIQRETSSWSGLKAVTAEQIQSLTETLEALKYLNSIDWAVVLDKEMPKYEDYVSERMPARSDMPNFDRMLLEADIEEVIGKDVLIRGRSLNNRGYSWYLFLKETPKQYKICDILEYYLEDAYLEKIGSTVKEVVNNNKQYPYNVSKDKIIPLICSPLETMEVQ